MIAIMAERDLRRAVELLAAGDWQAAHAIVQDDTSAAGAWLHGIVHTPGGRPGQRALLVWESGPQLSRTGGGARGDRGGAGGEARRRRGSLIPADLATLG